MVQYEEFVGKVNERIPAGFPAEARYAIQATLGTLGEHLSGAEAEALGARLPAELQAQLASGNYAEAAKKFSAVDFRWRVAEREGLPATEDGGIPGQASTDGVRVLLERKHTIKPLAPLGMTCPYPDTQSLLQKTQRRKWLLTRGGKQSVS